MMTSSHKIAFRRYVAFGIDWFVIAIWAGLLYGIVMLSFSGQPPSPSGPWAGQALGFLAMTLPIIFYFSICEASRWRATLGKRIMSLNVTSTIPDGISFKRIILRNAVKFAPWELGHLVANQAIFSSSSNIPIWVYVPMILSFAIPFWWVISILIRGNSPYDHLTGIRITLNDKKAG
jgi:uncharacterized RDD family membrane protein YckC